MKELSAKQCRAISLLAQGVSGRDVAKELSVTPQTISEWKKLPGFIAGINDLKMEALEKARTVLQFSTNIAVSALVDIAEKSENDEARRKAAMDILRMAGFEPGQHEPYAWGIGPRTTEKMEQEMNGTLALHNMLEL